MIDNTTSTVDAGSLTPQAKASAVSLVKTAHISTVADTEVKAADKVISQVDKVNEKSEKPSRDIEQVVDKLNAFVQLTQRDVSFGVDNDSGRDVISVFEAETQELIRQIPSEEALALLKRMDKAIGLLFSEKV